MELITVIVPIYNVEQYLNRCLESIITQSYSRLEIILVDDGSTDQSGAICDAWKNKDNRIEVIHKENGGLSSARNTGIECAKGQYYIFIDSDDAISKDMIQILYNSICKYGADISFCNYCTEIEELQDATDTYTEKEIGKIQMLMDLYNKNHICTVVACNKLYKKKLFENVRFSVGHIHEDEIIMHSLFDLCDNFVYVDCKLYFYYQRENSIVRTKIGKKNMSYLLALEERKKFFEDRKYTDLYARNMETYLDMNIYYSTFVSELTKEEKKKLFNKFKAYYHQTERKNKVRLYKRILWRCYNICPQVVRYALRVIKIVFFSIRKFQYE